MSNFLFAPLLAVLVGCSNEAPAEKSSENFSESVFILHDVRDTSVNDYYNEIIESPEFVNWRFNRDNPDTTKIKGSAMFSPRTLKIQDEIYFELDLTSYAFASKLMSTIPTNHVCTFRFSAEKAGLKIFNSATEEFLDFRTEAGRRYFKTILDA